MQSCGRYGGAGIYRALRGKTMTRELLEQYPDICAEIEELQREDHTEISDIVRGSSDEFPFTEHPITVRGRPVQRHTQRIGELQRQKTEIEQFVFHLPNAKTRRIVMLRAFHGYSWDIVAARMGHRYSIGALKQMYYRALGK